MHPIVPIIMALGAITFFIGLFIYTRVSLQRNKIVNIRGKEYKLWKFSVVTIGLGIALIMLSIFTHKNFAYEPEKPNSQTSQPILSKNLQYELEAIIPDYKSSTIAPFITRFQHEYQQAHRNEDENTMGLLNLEMANLLRTELQKQGHTPNRVEQEVKRIMSFLQQKSM